MITAYGDDGTRWKALEGGAEALLTKPIDFVGALRRDRHPGAQGLAPKIKSAALTACHSLPPFRINGRCRGPWRHVANVQQGADIRKIIPQQEINPGQSAHSN